MTADREFVSTFGTRHRAVMSRRHLSTNPNPMLAYTDCGLSLPATPVLIAACLVVLIAAAVMLWRSW